MDCYLDPVKSKTSPRPTNEYAWLLGCSVMTAPLIVCEHLRDFWHPLIVCEHLRRFWLFYKAIYFFLHTYWVENRIICIAVTSFQGYTDRTILPKSQSKIIVQYQTQEFKCHLSLSLIHKVISFIKVLREPIVKLYRNTWTPKAKRNRRQKEGTLGLIYYHQRL